MSEFSFLLSDRCGLCELKKKKDLDRWNDFNQELNITRRHMNERTKWLCSPGSTHTSVCMRTNRTNVCVNRLRTLSICSENVLTSTQTSSVSNYKVLNVAYTKRWLHLVLWSQQNFKHSFVKSPSIYISNVNEETEPHKITHTTPQNDQNFSNITCIFFYFWNENTHLWFHTCKTHNACCVLSKGNFHLREENRCQMSKIIQNSCLMIPQLDEVQKTPCMSIISWTGGKCGCCGTAGGQHLQKSWEANCFEDDTVQMIRYFTVVSKPWSQLWGMTSSMMPLIALHRGWNTWSHYVTCLNNYFY